MLSTEDLQAEKTLAEPGRSHRLHRWHHHRAKIAEKPTFNLAYRIIVGIVGLAVLIVGIAAIPYPGPGWLIVFAGLGILASEFEWAHRLLHWAKAKYDRVMAWMGRQPWWFQGLLVLMTAVVVVGTLWLLGTLGLIGGWFGLDWPWLERPFF